MKKLKTIYELEIELTKLIYNNLPYGKFIIARQLLKEIVSWKEVEIEDKEGE